MVTKLANGDQVPVLKAGNTLEIWVPIGSWGKGRKAVCDARIDDPFWSPTKMPLDVEDLFVRGVEGPRK